MELMQKYTDRAVVLSLVGEVEMTSAAKIRANVERLIAEKRIHVVIDLSRATGADSSGLGTLVASLTNLRKVGGELALCSLGLEIRNVMEFTNVLDFFPVYASEEEACAAFESISRSA